MFHGPNNDVWKRFWHTCLKKKLPWHKNWLYPFFQTNSFISGIFRQLILSWYSIYSHLTTFSRVLMKESQNLWTFGYVVKKNHTSRTKPEVRTGVKRFGQKWSKLPSFSVDSVLLVVESCMTTQNVGNSRIMGCFKIIISFRWPEVP